MSTSLAEVNVPCTGKVWVSKTRVEYHMATGTVILIDQY